MPKLPESRLVIHTTWGPIHVGARAGKICSCDLPWCDTAPTERPEIQREESHLADSSDARVLKQASRFIHAALKGRVVPVPPVELHHAPFFRACRHAMQKIKPGKMLTYRELAEHAGNGAAVRAAGQACARNPLPLFVPCHRVLATGGGLGGFSAGLAWKRFLLRVEANQ